MLVIHEIHLRNYKQPYTNDPYTVYVDNSENERLRFNVITSRLKVADRLDIHDGDKIECVAYYNTEPTTDYLIINITLVSYKTE